jgi:hypothetical protein
LDYQVITEDRHVQKFISSLVSRSVVEADKMSAKATIIDLILRIEDEEDEVKPGPMSKTFFVVTNSVLSEVSLLSTHVRLASQYLPGINVAVDYFKI